MLEQNTLNELRRLESKLDMLNILAMKIFSELLALSPASQAGDSFMERLRNGDPLAIEIAARRGLKLIDKEDIGNV